MMNSIASCDYRSDRHPVDRVKELEQEVAELRLDAERYRWLRVNDPNKVMSVNTNEKINRFFPNQLDESIDYHAAMKEAAK